MPQLSRRPRRRPTDDEPEEEPPRRRRTGQRRPADEEENEEDEEDEEDEEEQRTTQARSQKRRRRQEAAEERDDDDEEDDDDEGQDQDASHTQVDRQLLYQELLAKKLVRYALACEPRRVPIRRQAVKEQVLENQGKHFRKVFPIAQEQLQGIFGMRLVEWPARNEATMSVRERRKALRAQKTTASAASSAARADRFVLLSTLSDAYRAAVFADIPGHPARDANVMHALPPAPDAAYIGFVTMIVALVTLSGGTLAHADLEKYLTLLCGGGGGGRQPGPVRADAELLPVATALGDYIDDDDGGGGHSADASQHDADSAAVQGGTLQYLVRQGYLVRVTEAPTTVEGRGPVGGRSAGGGPGDAAKVTWHVGPRGRLEIGPAEVAAVVRHIYGPDAGPDVERRLQASLRVTNEDGSRAPEAGAAADRRQPEDEDMDES